MPPVRALYDRLLEAYGPQQWWPADSAWEMMVGAILTQNTAWTNVERAIARLKAAGALDLRSLHHASPEQVADWIRPVGYFNVKARRLRALTTLVMDGYRGRVDALLAEPRERLRAVLLEVNGIGPETADSIVLYAAGSPQFVVDAYTRRILVRHGWLDPAATYDETAAVFTAALPPDPDLFNEYHALVVAVGKNHCRARPDCASCPLSPWLPDGGPIGEKRKGS